MKQHEADRLIHTIRELVTESAPRGGDSTFQGGQRAGKTDGLASSQATPPTVSTNGKPEDREALYQWFKKRFIEDARIDPILVKLIASQPELELVIEPRMLTLEGTTVKGRTARLIAAGWFDSARSAGDARKELARTGGDPGGGGIGGALTALVTDGFLTREPDGYQKAPGIKITENRMVRA